LIYDAENRLVEVKKNGSTIAAFTFDGDGRRVKSVMGSETILFVGGHYEIANPGSGQTVSKYYFAGASRIAMRKYTIPQSMTVEYMLGDHLGSTSLTADATGNIVAELRYKAWGEVRYSSGNTPTKYQYTGQYSYVSDFGLHFYNARWYDSSLGRFAQADTVIPSGIQGYDRYAYVNNSPLKYTDPSGHDAWWCETASCSYRYYSSSYLVNNYSEEGELAYIKATLAQNYNVTLDDDGGRVWDLKNARVADLGFANMSKAANGKLNNISGATTLRLFTYEASDDCPTCTYSATTYRSGTVNFRITGTLRLQNLYHEFGHVIDNFLNDAITNNMESEARYTRSGNYAYGGIGIGELPEAALISGFAPDPNFNNTEALQHPSNESDEQWGDMWANYVIGNWNLTTDEGSLINQAVQDYLAPYVGTP